MPNNTGFFRRSMSQYVIFTENSV